MKNFIKKTGDKGFTLVELLISMAIFMVFTGILINSYGHLVRTQQRSNEYRILYSEAREVFDGMVQELRENAVDYGYNSQCGAVNGFNGPVSELFLISKDAAIRTKLSFDEEKKALFKFIENVKDQTDLVFAEENGVRLSSEKVEIEKMQFFVSPKINPYSRDNFSVQMARFHPKVTVFATFKTIGTGEEAFSFNLQTTVSSRFYNEIYPSKCI